MFLETVRQTTSYLVALTVVMVGLGLAILLESEVLLGVVVILPFLAALLLARIHHLSLTRQCLDSYLQKYQSLKR